MSFSSFSADWPGAGAPTPMMATSRIAVSLSRHVFVGKDLLVLGCVRQRFDHELHLHAVIEDAVLDRALGADQRKNARAFVEVDKRLKVGRVEAFWCKARDSVAVEPSPPSYLYVAHGTVAAA